MAGMPKRRAKREAAARQALAQAKNLPAVLKPDLPDTSYNAEIAEEITDLIADGVSIDDTMVGGAVAVPGVATRVGISSRTVYRWQKKYPEFSDKIKKAREESAHRLADIGVSLSYWVLENPAHANAVRVAIDGLKWAAAVRNKDYYGSKATATPGEGILINIGLSRPAENVINAE